MSMKSKKIERKIKRVKLPKDEELFPELFNGTAKDGMSSEFEELIYPCTIYEKIPESFKSAANEDLQKNLLTYIGEEVDCKLEERLLSDGARTDAPENKYLAFGTNFESSHDSYRSTKTSYTYFDKMSCALAKPSPKQLYYLDVAEDVFGGYASRQMNSLRELREAVTVYQPWYWLFLVPLAAAGLYKLSQIIFPSWPNFQDMVGFAALVVSVIALIMFFNSVKDYLDSEKAIYKKYKKGEMNVEEMMLGIYRSIRYRKILLKRMKLESKALDIQERRFYNLHKNGWSY